MPYLKTQQINFLGILSEWGPDPLLPLPNFYLSDFNFFFFFFKIVGHPKSYANLFMKDLENKILSQYRLKPSVWLRYIDDIFFIWDYGEDELKKWLKYLNGYHSKIKFTMEKSTDEISFLDTLVKRGHNDMLYTDLYTKPTDSHNYLRYDSAHPPHSKKGLPYGQFLRLKRICTNDKGFEKNAEKMKNDFIYRGYPKKSLTDSIEKCKELTRENLLAQRPKTKSNNDDTTYLVQTFRPCKNSLVDTIKTNWDILGRSKETKTMHRSKLTCSFKKPKSIKDYLVRAKTDYHPDSEKPKKDSNANVCNKPNCKYCKMLSTTGSITSKHSNEKYSTKHNVTCNSSNVIYCIECTTCKIQYVGQTKRKIKERIREHLYYTKKQIYKSDVPYHFNGTICTTQNMKVHIVDFIYEHPDSKRAKTLRNLIEFNWVSRLHTQSPNGLNTLDNRYG